MNNVKKKLSAPVYEPFVAFVEPKAAPYEVCSDSFSIGELVANEKVVELLKVHLPWALSMYESPLFVPHRFNFAVRDMDVFRGNRHGAQIEALDEDLEALGKVLD